MNDKWDLIMVCVNVCVCACTRLCVVLVTVELFNILQKYFYKINSSYCNYDNNFSHPGTY